MSDFMPNLERYLELLAGIYKEERNLLLQRIIVNAIPSFEYDYNGNTTLVLSIPKSLYLAISSDDRKEAATKIYQDYMDISITPKDYITDVVLTIQPSTDNWREKSGVLISENNMVSPATVQDIWHNSPIHVFFSYTYDKHQLVEEIKVKLSRHGFSCFMAEIDIPTSERWEERIKKALMSSHVVVAFLTGEYHKSLWTDQELGFAVARNIPIIPINLGQKPYGFISQFQELKCDTAKIADKLISCINSLEVGEIEDLNSYGAVYSLVHASSFKEANEAATRLYQCLKLTMEQVNDILDAYNSNSQIQNAHQINGKGNAERLISYLNKVTGNEYYLKSGFLSIKDNNP